MIPRHLKEQLIKRYKLSRSIYIFGPRQSGKTTIAKQTFPDLPYVTLEDPDVLEYATTDPRGFLEQFKIGAIIDEPQRYPELFSYLQSEIDMKSKKYILTSSQNFLTMESISQSLAGRITILNLMPLSKREIEGKSLINLETFFNDKTSNLLSINTLWDKILIGGYPEVVSNPGVFEYWYSDYVKTYIERDVRRIINVQDLSIFQKFMKLCAGRTGSILNKASLANDTGISEKSCTRWLSLLEQSGIIVLLKPYHNNFNKRQIKAPKIFFIDTGLCSYLLGIKQQDHILTHPLLGSMVETYVFSEIYKNFLNNGLDTDFYYWRDQNGNEIDLIIDIEPSKSIVIEIKAGQTINNKMLSSLNKWASMAENSKLILIYGGSQYQTRNGINILPINAL